MLTWPDSVRNPLGYLVDRLNEDRGAVFLVPAASGDDDRFFLSSPRMRLRCSSDNRNPNSIMIWQFEPATLLRWMHDSKSGLKSYARWTTVAAASSVAREKLLQVIRDKRSGAADGEHFWGYWRAYLTKASEKIDRVKQHPGWSYQKRRYGTAGRGRADWEAAGAPIDFQVDDQQEDILKSSESRLLVRMSSPNEKESYEVFEIQRASGPRWITASPMNRKLRMDSIPVSGSIKPDWRSLQTEYFRRKEALDKLSRGETALRSLNEVLPEGPGLADSGLHFSPILRQDYNADQYKAIAKTLVPGTVNCILGPPGTGKTSVIAEIASQIAKNGGRVLISAQSNLAVDNALERVLDSDDIFRVRLGRPESVRLNRELLLESASDRYRAKVSQKSKQAFDDEAVEVSKFPAIPELGEFTHITSSARALAETKNIVDKSARTLAVAEASGAKFVRRVHEAEGTLKIKVEQAGLSVEGVPAFISMLSNIRRRLTISELCVRRSAIQFALDNRNRIVSLRPAVMFWEMRCTQLAAAKYDLRNLDERISQSRIAEGRLIDVQRHNCEIESKRKNAGFWGGIWSLVADSIQSTDSLYSEIARLDRVNAQRDHPGVSAAIESRTDEVAQSAFLLSAALQQLEKSTDLMQVNDCLTTLESDLEIGTFLDTLSALRYLNALSYADEIEQAWAELKAAIADYQCAQVATADLRSAAVNAKKRLAELSVCIKALTALALQFGIPVTSSLATASPGALGKVIVQLEMAVAEATRRRDRWAILENAFEQYHARLAFPNVNLQKAVLAEANVVAATCSGIAGATQFDFEFDYVIIDEAGRGTPLDLLIPIIRGKTIVLVGDHRQLPPMLDNDISNELAAEEASEITLFERLFNGLNPARTQALSWQYRMVPIICDIVSEISYRPDQLLEPKGEALTRQHKFQDLKTIHWVKCEGKDNEAQSSGSPSLFNKAEVRATVSILNRLSGELLGIKPERPYTIGVIAMYRQQVRALEDAIATDVWNNSFLDLELGTVDAFQGREKDAILLSFVATDARRKYFFYDRRRLNVALSRARELLVVIGSIHTLGRSQKVFGRENPVRKLHELLVQCALAGHASSEVFHAD